MYKHLALAASVALALSACGKKNADPAPEASAQPAANQTGMADSRFKQAGKFGVVSAVDLTPVFVVPQKYSSYVRQEITETTKEEYRNLPEQAFQTYVKTWLTQAASVEKPDWDTLAAIVYPDSVDEPNAFKKQEAADKAKSTLPTDKHTLDAAFGWQGEVLSVRGPDVTNGEYYLTISQHSRYRTVSYYNGKKYSYNLFYHPNFEAVGLHGENRGDIELTVKVPIDKAKEIESLREGNTMFMRVYGHVKGIRKDNQVIRSDLSEADLDVDVAALEFGVRKDGKFQTLFFLDTDQLRKPRT
jgi:hypothetical protein